MSRAQHILILLAVLALSFSAVAQDDQEQLFEDAETAYYNDEFTLARDLFQELLLGDSKNPYYKFMLGQTYLHLREHYERAETLLAQAAEQIKGADTVHYVQYNLAWAMHLNLKFEKAIIHYERTLVASNYDQELRAYATRGIEMCYNGIKLIKRPEPVQIDNIGSPINGSTDDYAPVISADNRVLMFTSRRPGSTGELLDFSGKYYEDIYYTEIDENGKWGVPQNIGKPINTEDHESSVGMTVDGEELIVYRFSTKKGDGDLYRSKRNGLKWGIPKLLSDKINSRHQETRASISFDGKTMYFTSNKNGGEGSKDIYVSTKLSDGTWGKARNVGNIINTKYDEESPFIHPDGKTLYFSSKGHNTMGGYDIFKSELQADGNWGYPLNIGYPINTPTDDIHFVLSANGQTGYYASSQTGGKGEQDIYVVNMPSANVPLTMVRGEVIMSDGKSVPVDIKVIDKASGNQVKYVYNPNPETGKYLIILPPGRDYDMLVEAEGYHSYVFNIYIPNQDHFYELYQTMYMKTIDAFGDTLAQGVTLENSFYDVTDSLVETMSDDEARDRDDFLLGLIDNIVQQTDSLELDNLEKNYDATNDTEVKSTTEDKIPNGDFFDDRTDHDHDMDPLLNLVDQLIEATDTTAIARLDKIAEDGFFENANKNVVFFDEKTDTQLEPMAIGKDTVYVIPPSVRLAQEIHRKHLANEISDEDVEEFNSSPKTDNLVVALRNKEPLAEKGEAQDQKNLEAGQKILLERTFTFGVNLKTLSKYDLQQLDNIAQTVFDHPNLIVQIAGHTDDQGTEALNLRLSRKRGEYIASYFKLYDIDHNRVEVIAYGEIRPIGSNKTEEGRAKNRRVEIKIIDTGDY